MNHKTEKRFFDADFNTSALDDNSSRIVGRPVVLEARTDLGFCEEIIDKDALINTDLRDVLFFTNHDDGQIPLARSRGNKNGTMRLVVDENGIEIDALLDVENNTHARALYSAIKRGDITGMSFAFSVDGEAWENLESEKPLRRITSISNIYEVSAVNSPAYEQTSLSARDTKALESVERSLVSARAEAKLEKEAEQKCTKIKEELELEKLKLEVLFL